MGKLIDFRKTKYWSIRALSEELGFNRKQVTKRLENVQPAAERNSHPVYQIRDVLVPLAPLLSGKSYNAGVSDPDKLSPVDRKYHWEAEKKQIEVETLQNQLIPENEVREV